MNDQISWDSSLVKKFSSSNHFKLLNQLRNEVKKYPLNKKKKITNDNNIDTRNNPETTKYNENTNTKVSYIYTENKSNESTISFNNSKNFSIYNNINNESKNENSENIFIEEKIKKTEPLSSTFKDRLNQVDLK